VILGGQIRESAKALLEREAKMAGVLCVVDRQEGGRENLAKDDLVLHSLDTMTELKEAISSR
jgi:orotate phosphoribosyltransferase